MDSRKGKFKISEIVLMRGSKELYEIFGNVIVWKTEVNPLNRIYTYYATSPLFEEVKEGTEIPYYQMAFEGTNVKAIKIH